MYVNGERPHIFYLLFAGPVPVLVRLTATAKIKFGAVIGENDRAHRYE
jgi:hypothetical protein